MTTEQDIPSLEQNYLLHTYNRPEFVLSHGEGVWLYDTAGRKYLDAGSGIAVTALGHQHKAVTAALESSVAGLLHVSNLYHTAPHALLARDLCESSFADKVFFCNSGAEANEGALKFARKWATSHSQPDKKGLLAFSGSFHGRTMGALSVTATKKYRDPFEPLIGAAHFAEFNDLTQARHLFETEQLCAVIVEPVQGEGGVNPATPEFLQGLRDLCDEYAALLIFDEIQCGMGRTGTLWAYEDYGVTPDMMTLAKPLGGGLPIGAVLVNERVAEVMQPGDHGSTFAGGPFVCTVARAVFNQIEQPEFLATVQATSHYLAEKLHDLSNRSPLISGVRGKGLMWGLVSEIPAGAIMQEAYQHGLMILVAGPQVVRLLPPLVITPGEVDILIARLVDTLEAVG